MKARDIMNPQVITIPETATYEETARILADSSITGAPVVDKKGKVIGFISEKDLLRVLYPYYQSYYKHPSDYNDPIKREEKKVKEIRRNTITRFMRGSVYSIEPEMPLMRVGAIMLARNVTNLPVIENDTLVGVINRGDLYKKILSDHLNIV